MFSGTFEQRDFPLIEVNYEQGVFVWGIVRYSIRKH